MDSSRWEKIKDLFEAALELEPAHRAAYLDNCCGGDQALRAELEGLLAEEQEAGSFMQEPAIGTGALRPLLRFDPPSPASNESAGTAHKQGVVTPTKATTEVAAGLIPNSPDRVGRYRLLEKIGEGGMGEVWRAEQTEPVRRRVAVKLVRAGMNTREVIARFESERQALALMDHHSIAKVFDAGSTVDGAPYFVMEYVAGIPITTYCDNHRLSTRERLQLFVHVCEGVQHAHQKAIIHRDLKPSNILVTEVDGRPVPKIIDFGVAKALGQKLTVDTMFTRVGAIIGTPEYMSPEQANSSGEDIDTRSDVYSLGVILYELLAGAPPIDLRKIAFDQFLRRLREEEPSKPSTKIRTQDPATLADTARNRQSEPLALAKQVSGDLDSIALKALEKDRSLRYGSPSEFASDIERYLKSEPVLAVGQSAAYRARKFARRYRGAIATACAFALILMLAAAVSIWQSIRAAQQRDRADSEAAAALAVNDFLRKDLLAQASAYNQSEAAAKPDPGLTVRAALDRAATRIAGRFDRQPEVEAAIRETIGQTYEDLGVYPEARTQLEQAVRLYRKALGTNNPKVLRTMTRLGRVADLQGRYTEAEAICTEAFQMARRLLGPEHPDTLAAMIHLSNVYVSQGKYPRAEELYKQAWDIQRRVLGSGNANTIASMHNLALVYDYEGKYQNAVELYQKTLEIARRAFGPEYPGTLNVMQNLATAYMHEGKYAQAEALYNQALPIQRRVLGPDHSDTLWSMNNLAEVYGLEGKYQDAEALFRHTLDVRRRVLGPEHPQTIASMEDLAGAYEVLDRYPAAEALLGESLEASRRVLGPQHPQTLSILADFASMYERQHKYTLAESYADQALAGRRHTLGSADPSTMACATDLAIACVALRHFDKSEVLAREVLDFERKRDPDGWQRFLAEGLLGASLAGKKLYAEAEPLLLQGYRGMMERKERIPVPDRYHLELAREWLVHLYTGWGKPDRAAGWGGRK